MAHKEFEKLKKLYKESNLTYFSMAVCHLLANGFNDTLEISDDEISKMKSTSNGMSDEFVRWINKTARDIAIAADGQPANLIEFCQAIELFDIQHFCGKLNRHRLEEMVENQIFINKYSTRSECERQCEKLGCEMEELEMLGVELPDGWDEWE